MTAARRWLGFVSCTVWTVACAVYQDDLVPGAKGGSLGESGSGGAQPSTDGGNAGSNLGASAGMGTPLGGTPASGGGPGADSGGSSAETSGGDGGNGGDSGESTGGVGEAGAPNAGGSGGGGQPSLGGQGSGGAAGGGQGNGGVAGGGGVAGSGGAAGSGGNQGSGGVAGSGGSQGAPQCSDHPLTARATWKATSSHDNSGTSLAKNVLDGATTRWTTGKAQSGDEWLQIDFGASVSLSYVNLQQSAPYGNDYPRQYAVRVSDTPLDAAAPARVTGIGTSGVSTIIALPAIATGRYLFIKQLGASLSWWSAVEIEVSCID